MDPVKPSRRPLQFDDKKTASMIAIHIAAGEWGVIGISEERARNFLLDFIRKLESHGHEAICEVVWPIQNFLMARREKDFLSIQKSPVFSPHAMQTMEVLDETWSSDGKEGFLELWKGLFDADGRKVTRPHQVIRVSGGPGDSPDTAFTVSAPDAETRICAEYWYLYYTYGQMSKDWWMGKRYLTDLDEQGRQYDVLHVKLSNGEEKTLHFVRWPNWVDNAEEEEEEDEPDPTPLDPVPLLQQKYKNELESIQASTVFTDEDKQAFIAYKYEAYAEAIARRIAADLYPRCTKPVSKEEFVEEYTKAVMSYLHDFSSNEDPMNMALEKALAEVWLPWRTESDKKEPVRNGNEAAEGERRYQFDEAQMLALMVTHIAAGRWESVNGSEEKAKNILLLFLRVLKIHGFYEIRAVFEMVQKLLMAQRSLDFLSTQIGWAFHRYALCNMVALDCAWVDGGEEAFLEEWNQIFAPGWQGPLSRHKIIRFTGGPGDSPETAFHFHARDYEAAIRAANWYLCHTYGRLNEDWEKTWQEVEDEDEQGRKFDVVGIKLSNGDEKKLFFVRSLKSNRAEVEAANPVGGRRNPTPADPGPTEEELDRWKIEVENIEARTDLSNDDKDDLIEQKLKEHYDASFEGYIRRVAAATDRHSTTPEERQQFIEDYVKVATAHHRAPAGQEDEAFKKALREAWKRRRREKEAKAQQESELSPEEHARRVKLFKEQTRPFIRDFFLNLGNTKKLDEILEQIKNFQPNLDPSTTSSQPDEAADEEKSGQDGILRRRLLRDWLARDPDGLMQMLAVRKPRSEYTNAELVLITATYRAAGDWEPGTETNAKDFLLKFIRGLSEHGFESIRGIFLDAQYAVMAVGRKSFLNLQELPPFSQFGFLNMVTLDGAWLSGGDNAFESEWSRIFAPGWKAGVPPNRLIRLTGGRGDCEDNAFQVHAPDVEARICAEYWHIYYTYGRRDVGWKYSSQYLTPADEQGREFDVIEVELPDGEIKPIFFVRHPQYHQV